MTTGLAPASVADVIAHHLALMGLPADRLLGSEPSVLVMSAPSASEIPDVRQAVTRGTVVVAVCPRAGFCETLDISVGASRCRAPAVMRTERAFGLVRAVARRFGPGHPDAARYRSLHPALTFDCKTGRGLLWDERGEAVWWWLPLTRGGVVLVGSALADDLVRYRQGDPVEAEQPDYRERWGFAGERPNYLFEPQRAGERSFSRHADDWAWLLARVLHDCAGIRFDPVLPSGAAGAIVLTGDDDQAALDFYREQLALLGETPITYFLHPKTKHTAATLRSMLERPGIELGLHPDALDAPDRYDALFREQAAWFRSLAGHPTRTVRNHGFLNRGYWGHLDAWLREGVAISSNLPGFDGTVLTGSLLPARVCQAGRLTAHWSILTAIGDGILFAKGWSPRRAAGRVLECADRIRASGVPGVLVLNLHPENVAANREMTLAALEVCRSGFLAWTLRDCHSWFAGRDVAALEQPPAESDVQVPPYPIEALG